MNEKLAAIETPQLQDQVQIRRKQDGDAEKKRTKKKRRRPRKKKKKAASSENHPKEQRRRKERKLPRQKYQGRGKDMSPPNQRLPQFFKQGFGNLQTHSGLHKSIHYFNLFLDMFLE